MNTRNISDTEWVLQRLSEGSLTEEQAAAEGLSPWNVRQAIRVLEDQHELDAHPKETEAGFTYHLDASGKKRAIEILESSEDGAKKSNVYIRKCLDLAGKEPS